MKTTPKASQGNIDRLSRKAQAVLLANIPSLTTKARAVYTWTHDSELARAITRELVRRYAAEIDRVRAGSAMTDLQRQRIRELLDSSGTYQGQTNSSQRVASRSRRPIVSAMAC